MFRWQNVLLSDSSSDEDFGHEIKVTDADVRSMLRNHVREKKAREAYSNDPNQAWASSIIFFWNNGINQRELDYIVLTRISWHSYNTVSTNVADIGKTSTCYSVALTAAAVPVLQHWLAVEPRQVLGEGGHSEQSQARAEAPRATAHEGFLRYGVRTAASARAATCTCM